MGAEWCRRQWEYYTCSIIPLQKILQVVETSYRLCRMLARESWQGRLRHTHTHTKKCRNTNKQANNSSSSSRSGSCININTNNINQTQLSSIDFSYLFDKLCAVEFTEGQNVFGFLFILLYSIKAAKHFRTYTTKQVYENKFHEWHRCNGLPNIFYGFFRAFRKLFIPFLPQNSKASDWNTQKSIMRTHYSTVERTEEKSDRWDKQWQSVDVDWVVGSHCHCYS